MADNVLTVSEADFEEQVLKAELPTVVDLWAEWCAPCLMVGPILEELANDYAGKVAFARLDVDQNAAIAAQYRVMSIPTMILFKDGEVVDAIIGARRKRDYQHWIDSKL